jgi:hypothetical protein
MHLPGGCPQRIALLGLSSAQPLGRLSIGFFCVRKEELAKIMPHVAVVQGAAAERTSGFTKKASKDAEASFDITLRSKS